MADRRRVEFDVALDGSGERCGSMVTWALPSPGDWLRVDEPEKQPVYEVVRCYFEPTNITVLVRPADGPMPTVESADSLFFGG